MKINKFLREQEFVILNRMIRKSTIQLLRFHFSLFLLPVFLFALSQVNEVPLTNAILSFFILHLLVYPASNGYNSYMDRDESSIGGLFNPLKPTKQLYYVTIAMDMIAVLLGFSISIVFSLGTLLYIVASRLYSYRKVRLKKYPVIGFITVFLFQGALIYFLSYHACHPGQPLQVPFLPCIISSCLIAALYPLTQIYQHEEDINDGVITISYLVGIRGTFILSMSFFLLASFLFFLFFQPNHITSFYLYLLIMAPVVLFFLHWMYKCWNNASEANYINSLRMNTIATVSTTIFFVILIIGN